MSTWQEVITNAITCALPLVLPPHLSSLLSAQTPTYSRNLDPVAPRCLSVGCKRILSSLCTWTQGGLTCADSLRFQSLVRTVPEESECTRWPGCGSWTGCRDTCVSTFKDATSGPSQKTPWKGIEFLHLVAGLSGIQPLASGQAATPAPVGGVPSPPKVGGPGVGSPRAQSQSAAGACQAPEGIRAQQGSPVPTNHAAAPELAVRLAPLFAKMSRGAGPRSPVIGGERNSRPAHFGHVVRPAQLDNAAPSPSAPLPPRPAAAAAPSPFVQDGGAGGAASWAAAAAALRDPRAARPPSRRNEAAERARLQPERAWLVIVRQAAAGARTGGRGGRAASSAQGLRRHQAPGSSAGS